ncbi:phosphatidate cytidylyltransferase [Paracoccus sp. p3-h83]|uniref:phosphatidate cytidylyltransferase n=1 Tax=Paracoccus sp. p3-h83 TaxID=3342805 RepID=UPI0035BA4CF2
MTGRAGIWHDLGPRLISALVMIAVGGAGIWLGGVWLRLVVLVAGAAMMWELIRMTHSAWGDPDRGQALIGAGAMAVGLGIALFFDARLALLIPVVAAPFVAGHAAGPALRLTAPLYAAAIAVTAFVITALREQGGQVEGLAAVGWLIGVVVASDVMGYLAGRALGGPKFWPSVSPKKTWSGTVAGWVGAALVGLGFAIAGLVGWAIVPVSVVVAFAGQMGDIAESAMKRRAGVKDSSNLIPGHGGFLDRFDAVIGAAMTVYLLSLAGLMPQFGG